MAGQAFGCVEKVVFVARVFVGIMAGETGKSLAAQETSAHLQPYRLKANRNWIISFRCGRCACFGRTVTLPTHFNHSTGRKTTRVPDGFSDLLRDSPRASCHHVKVARSVAAFAFDPGPHRRKVRSLFSWSYPGGMTIEACIYCFGCLYLSQRGMRAARWLARMSKRAVRARRFAIVRNPVFKVLSIHSPHGCNPLRPRAKGPLQESGDLIPIFAHREPEASLRRMVVEADTGSFPQRPVHQKLR